MKKLNVYIEINGMQTHVGSITGNSSLDAQFSYSDEYIAANHPPISISLPVSSAPFRADITKNFFEGLLPEGFARKSVANWIHAAEEDYLAILQVLGAECIGAIRISDNTEDSGNYEPLSVEEVRALAREGVTKSTELVTAAHLSLTGASGKAGLYYDHTNHLWYKPIGNAPSTHIVKQSHVRLSDIVTNEQLSLATAAKLGISVPESFIINTGSAKDEEILLATKRYDRKFSKEPADGNELARPLRLHQEDFAQALGISSFDKYERGDQKYLARIFGILRKNVMNPMEDQLKLWDILIYDFLVGNTDNHIKNISLLYSENLKSIRLAPAYDIISTVIYQGSSREMAIGIGGERMLGHITREHFAKAAADAGLSKKLALKHLDMMAGSFEDALKEAARKLTEDGYPKAKDIMDQILKNGGYSYL